MQPGTLMDQVLKEKTFPEPRLIMFIQEETMKNAQGFIIAERSILFEVENFNILNGISSLLAAYYVFHVAYPKSSPAAGMLLFFQEVLLGKEAISARRTSKYCSFINSLLH